MKQDKIPNNLINNIILGDCLEVMKRIPDESTDVTFADPPFNLKKIYNNYNDKKTNEEYLVVSESECTD